MVHDDDDGDDDDDDDDDDATISMCTKLYIRSDLYIRFGIGVSATWRAPRAGFEKVSGGAYLQNEIPPQGCIKMTLLVRGF
eukprot:229052-Karenia_brevis.AAC.1